MNLDLNSGFDQSNLRYIHGLNKGSNGYGFQGFTAPGYFEDGSRLRGNFRYDLSLNWKKTLYKTLDLRLSAGNDFYRIFDQGVSGTAAGLEIPGFFQLNNTSNQSAYSTKSKHHLASVYGNAEFELLDLIIMGGYFRHEWSSLLPKTNNTDQFASLNLEFVFSRLTILEKLKFIRFGKLRAAYTQMSNPAFGAPHSDTWAVANISDGWTPGISFPFMGTPGFQIGSKANYNLMNEKIRILDAGLNLNLFSDRILLGYSFFNSESYNLIIPYDVAPSNGILSIHKNSASMRSRGTELDFSILPFESEKFGWMIRTIYTRFSNKVNEIPNGEGTVFLGGFTDPQVLASSGNEYPSIYGYDYWRTTGGELLINDNPSDAYPDGFPFGNYNLQYLGDVNPDYTIGLENNIRLFNFRLYALFDIRKGGVMWNGSRGALRYFGAHSDTESRDDASYIFEGVKGHLEFDPDGNQVPVTAGEKNDMPVARDIDWYMRGEGSGFTGPTITIEPTDWFRLREISLRYSIKISNLDIIESAVFYVTARNILINTTYKGIDPETSFYGSGNVQGLEYFNMPGARSYSMGFFIKF